MVNHKKSFQVGEVGPEGEQQIITGENNAIIANVGKDSKLGTNQLEEENQYQAFINFTIVLNTGVGMQQKGKEDSCEEQEKKCICDGNQFFDHEELYSEKMGPYYSQEFYGHKMGALNIQELDAVKMGGLYSQELRDTVKMGALYSQELRDTVKMGALYSQELYGYKMGPLYGQMIYNCKESGNKICPLTATGLVQLSDQQDEGEVALIPSTCNPEVSINLSGLKALLELLGQMKRIQWNGELKHISQKTYLPEQDKIQEKAALCGSKDVQKKLAGSKKNLLYIEGPSPYKSGSAGFNKNNFLYPSVENAFNVRTTEILFQYLDRMVMGLSSRSHDHSQKVEPSTEACESETSEETEESSHSSLQLGTDSGDGIPDGSGGMLEQKPKYGEDIKILGIDKELSKGCVSKRKKSIDESGDEHGSWEDYPQEGWRNDQQLDPGLKINVACLGLNPAALSDGIATQQRDVSVEEQDISSSLTEDSNSGDKSFREKRPEVGTAAAHQSILMENTRSLSEDSSKTEDADEQVTEGDFGTNGEAGHDSVSRETSGFQAIAPRTIPDSTPQREESPRREPNRRRSTTQTTSVSGHDIHSGMMPDVSGRNQRRPDRSEKESRKGTGVTAHEIDSELPECSTPPPSVSAAWGETTPRHETVVEASLDHEPPTVSFHAPVQVTSPGNSQHQMATFLDFGHDCYADSGATPQEKARTVPVQESQNGAACGGWTSAITQALSVHVSALAERSRYAGVAEEVSFPPCFLSRQAQDQQEWNHPAVQAQDQRESNYPERSLYAVVAEAVPSPPCCHSRRAQVRQEPIHPAVPPFPSAHELPVSHHSIQPDGRPQSIPAESGAFQTPSEFQTSSEFPPPSESSQPVPLRLPSVTVHAASSLPPWAAQTSRIDLTRAVDRGFVALTKRRATYGEDWPYNHSGIDAACMALSGFFLTGPGHRVRCFYCGLELDGLTSVDNIWDEHVRHNPDCVYLKAVMGSDFLQETLRQLHDKHA